MKKELLLKAEILRLKADKLLKIMPKDDSQLTVTENYRLIKELEKYNSDLLSLNKSLVEEFNQTEIAENKYANLYNLAPISIFTLSRDGEILELNISGSQMLDKETNRLINSRFGFFVLDETKPIFNHFLEKVFESHERETCEVILSCEGQRPIKVRLIGIENEIEKVCVLIVLDFTSHIPL
jgi:hypothetical protein